MPKCLRTPWTKYGGAFAFWTAGPNETANKVSRSARILERPKSRSRLPSGTWKRLGLEAKKEVPLGKRDLQGNTRGRHRSGSAWGGGGCRGHRQDLHSGTPRSPAPSGRESQPRADSPGDLYRKGHRRVEGPA